LLHPNKGLFHQVFAEEPALQFIGAKHVTDDQVIGTVVAYFISPFRQFAAVPDDDLVGVQKTGNLNWNFFPAPRWALDARRLGDVGSHGNRDSPEKLNSFRNGIHKFRLFSVMLVEQQMELIESWSGNLPV